MRRGYTKDLAMLVAAHSTDQSSAAANALPGVHMSDYNLSIIEQPTAAELATLFSQTTWANDRSQANIEKMLRTLHTFVVARQSGGLRQSNQ
jgi:hypothetical protein